MASVHSISQVAYCGLVRMSWSFPVNGLEPALQVVFA
jgi:hypothetical protein